MKTLLQRQIEHSRQHLLAHVTCASQEALSALPVRATRMESVSSVLLTTDLRAEIESLRSDLTQLLCTQAPKASDFLFLVGSLQFIESLFRLLDAADSIRRFRVHIQHPNRETWLALNATASMLDHLGRMVSLFEAGGLPRDFETEVSEIHHHARLMNSLKAELIEDLRELNTAPVETVEHLETFRKYKRLASEVAALSVQLNSLYKTSLSMDRRTKYVTDRAALDSSGGSPEGSPSWAHLQPSAKQAADPAARQFASARC